MKNTARLRTFVQEMTELITNHRFDEAKMLASGETLLRALIAHDDWLPEEFATPSAESYRQYLLYCDPLERFSVVSFVWLPGHRTPVHDHGVWGLIGVLRGEELCDEYDLSPWKRTGSHRVRAGDVDRVSPHIGDVHRVSNPMDEGTAVSIHVYGANIGAQPRHAFDPATGARTDFVSGYHNAVVPNLWDRTKDAHP